MSLVIQSTQEFEALVQKHEHIIIDFFADWCAPCKMMAQVLLDIENQKLLPEDVKIVKINVDANSDLAQKYEVQALPTFIFLKKGVEADRFVGFRPAQEIIQTANNVFK